MELRKFGELSWVWCIVIRTSTSCRSSYITRAINGYICQPSVYKNISDVQFRQCTNACIGTDTCWTLSYNYIGRYCLIAAEPCVTAELNKDFSMMILRIGETHNCLEWIPFNKTYGLQYGYPGRAVQATLINDRSSVVARAASDQGILMGRILSNKHVAELLDVNQNFIEFDHGYEILVIQESCSSAWLPYTPHEPIPARAVMAWDG